MFKAPTFRSAGIPLIAAVIATAVLNFGLYTRLAAIPALPTFAIPYYEDFSTVTSVPYPEFGGDWEIRDQALIQMSTSGYDLTAYAAFNLSADQPYKFEATLRYLGGAMGGGLIFNAQQTTSRQKSHMVRFNVDQGQIWMIYGFFGDDSNFRGQGSALLSQSPEDPTPHRLGVLVRADTYDLVLDGTTIAQNIPLEYKGGSIGFISATSQVSFDDIVVDNLITASEPTIQATPQSQEQPTPIAADPVTDWQMSDSFDPESQQQALWLPISGSWAFEPGAYVQSQTDGFDFSSIYQQAFTDINTIRTTFQHRSGTGGGLVFNLPASNLRNGGQMVRYFDPGNLVAWGYYDNDGAFNGQGSAEVAPASTDTHALEVRISATTYAIWLDGRELVTNVPLFATYSQSYIGLTSSQSITAFDEIAVSSQAANPAGYIPEIDTVAASGNWTITDGYIVQNATELTDYIAGTGLAGEEFVISVDILLSPDIPEIGAGIVFHMAGRDDRRLGTMVRLANNGQEIFWGRYDENGVFQGEGGAPLTLSAQPAHTLTITVRAESYAIQVDDTVVAEAIPLTQTNGWIGLLSFSGPVRYSMLRLSLGE